MMIPTLASEKDDLISRKHLLEKIFYGNDDKPWFGEYDSRVYKMVKNEPTVIKAEALEQMKESNNNTGFPEGKWTENYDKNREWWCRRRFYCSNCGDWQTYGKPKYCPNCGAKMEREDEDCG